METHPLTLYRLRHGLSLQDFGERVGASKSSMSKYERRASVPRRRVLLAIIAATNGEVSAADFYHASDDTLAVVPKTENPTTNHGSAAA